MEWLELESEYVWVYLLVYLAVLFFQKKIKINDDTTSSLLNWKIRICGGGKDYDKEYSYCQFIERNNRRGFC